MSELVLDRASDKKSKIRSLIGAAFLMATSAIGPGFLTQTTVFTQKLQASLAFVIAMSIIIDIIVQLNIWRIIAVTERRAQDIANMVVPGLGYVISALIVLGGFVFNIGNIAGAGLGIHILFPQIPIVVGALISAIIAVFIFVSKDASKLMDYFILVLGTILILLMLYVAYQSSPPVVSALKAVVLPESISFMAIVTLVGGTVGGYITYAGGHRLLDVGVKGKSAIKVINKSAISAISIASVIRVLLFLAALGVISQGVNLNPSDPAGSVFSYAAGAIGYKFFGFVLWAASISSVIGAAYTSTSFVQTFHPWCERYKNTLIIAFIVISTLIFASIGKPVTVLILAGAVNGMILPLTLFVMLLAVYKKSIRSHYRHPVWLTVTGLLVVIVMAYMSIAVIGNLSGSLF
ncbi:NRAMP family divalent metal transporter [Fangia hongkongensis]|uniref:NRAMP family divalent metal transporter n=1 Tax=Fangia hongkongensis TaxID=270495 RepID=UPI00036AAAB1|nr:NRAMP family divalent metal transporter [Fangia hongkongensis]MBK2124971.1 divalent metal cation transporter [Fangia hongkongensis]